MIELILLTLSLHTPNNNYNNENWGVGVGADDVFNSQFNFPLDFN